MIDSEIDPNQTIFRFLNFFDLYKLIKNRQLRFTSLHQLDDKNEGFGKILRSIELSPACPTNSIIEYPIIKHTTYVSCWTIVPDNIAMWMLYSPDKSGIRIQTTVAKLHAAIETYKTKYPSNINKIENYQPGHIDVFKMDYRDLRKTKKEIEENNNTIIMAMREAKKGKSRADACRAWFNTMRDSLKDKNILDNDAMKYKDKNYIHEQEIRGYIEFEPTTEEEYDHLHMENCDFKNFTSFIWLKVDKCFLEEICIDPRCPDYKKEIYKEIVDPKDNVKFVKSEAFGIVL